MICPNCSCQFVPKKVGQKLCSRRCCLEVARQTMRATLSHTKLICRGCQEPFVPHASVQRFCSRNCAVRFRYKTDPEPKRAINRRNQDAYRQRVIALLGGHCVACGETDWHVLQVNHRNGGGSKERSQPTLRGSNFFTAILAGRRGTDDLDLRCANCNTLYEYERRAQ